MSLPKLLNDINNKFEVTGGVLEGNMSFNSSDPIIYNSEGVSGKRIRLYSGANAAFDGGAGINLYQKDHTTTPGMFMISAHDGTNEGVLRGYPNGDLTWNGNKLYGEHNQPQIEEVISIAKGGTGATDAATALSNLGGLSTSGGTIRGDLIFKNLSHIYSTDLAFLHYITNAAGTDSKALWINNSDYKTSLGDAIWFVHQTKDADGNLLTDTKYKLYGEHNKPTAADVGALSLTGGTITGNLVVNGNLLATGLKNYYESTITSAAPGWYKIAEYNNLTCPRGMIEFIIQGQGGSSRPCNATITIDFGWYPATPEWIKIEGSNAHCGGIRISHNGTQTFIEMYCYSSILATTRILVPKNIYSNWTNEEWTWHGGELIAADPNNTVTISRKHSHSGGESRTNDIFVKNIYCDSITSDAYATKIHSNAKATTTDLTHIPTDAEIALETGNGDGAVSAWIWREKYQDNWGIFHDNAANTLKFVGGNAERASINLSNGKITGNTVAGAVWNDYAEFRSQVEEVPAGYCVMSNDDGRVSKTTERLQACDGITSDTYGFSIGETDECKTPLAVAGRVLAYCEGDRNDYHAGDTVCAAADGLVSKMTREEIREYPDRIVGIVSEIPKYEIWGSGNIEVNNRIWIKVR